MPALFDDLPSVVIHAGVRYRTDGVNMLKDIGGSTYWWGVPIPAVVHVAEAVEKEVEEPEEGEEEGEPAEGGGGEEGDGIVGQMDAGTYAIHVVFMNRWGKRSNPNPSGPVLVTLENDGGAIQLSNLPVSDDPQVNGLQIFATYPQSDGAAPAPPYLFCGIVENGVTEFLLNVHHSNWPTTEFLEPPESVLDPEAALGGPFRYDGPPVKRRLASWDGRIWAAAERVRTDGVASATHGSQAMTGSEAVRMTAADVGRTVLLDLETAAYRIESVESPTEWTVDRPYERPSWRTEDPENVPVRVAGNMNELVYSETDEPEYFPPTNAFNVGLDEGADIVGLYPFGDELLVATTRAVFAVYRGGTGNLPYGLRRTNASAGVASARSGVVAKGVLFYFSGDGFHTYANNVSRNIGLPLADLPKNLVADLAPHVTGVHHGERIYWAVSIADALWLDAVLVFDLDTAAWDLPWRGMRIYDFGALDNADRTGRSLVFTSPAGEDAFVLNRIDAGWWYDGTNNVRIVGKATDGGSNWIEDAGAAFATGNAGVRGALVRVRRGTGAGQERFVASNTADRLTVEPPFETAPDATSEYEVGVVGFRFKTGRVSFGAPNDEKVFSLVEMNVL